MNRFAGYRYSIYGWDYPPEPTRRFFAKGLRASAPLVPGVPFEPD